MVYTVSSDASTKISEKSGTIQNFSSYRTLELSDSPNAGGGIYLAPNQKISFSGTDIYLRCVEEGTAEVHVVPFVLSGGGSSAQVTLSGTTATNAEVDAMLDKFLPTITGG